VVPGPSRGAAVRRAAASAPPRRRQRRRRSRRAGARRGAAAGTRRLARRPRASARPAGGRPPHRPRRAARGRHTWGTCAGRASERARGGRPRATRLWADAAAAPRRGGERAPRRTSRPCPRVVDPPGGGGWPYLGSTDRLTAAPPAVCPRRSGCVVVGDPSHTRSLPNQCRVDPSAVQGAATHTETDGNRFARADLHGPPPRSAHGLPPGPRKYHAHIWF